MLCGPTLPEFLASLAIGMSPLLIQTVDRLSRWQCAVHREWSRYRARQASGEARDCCTTERTGPVWQADKPYAGSHPAGRRPMLDEKHEDSDGSPVTAATASVSQL